MYRLDKETGKQKFFAGDGTKSVISALISIFIGMLVGTLIVVFVGLNSDGISAKGILEGIKLIFLGLFSTGRDGGDLSFGFNVVNIGNMLFRATPLILTGLSVAVAFKTGLFNIGAPGQYLMGTAASICIALSVPTSSVPAGIVWVLAFCGGILAGALWGAVPGALKAFLNINEVITCIMTNWIAANLVTWFFDKSNLKNMTEAGKVGYTYKTSVNGVQTPGLGLDKIFAGSQVNGGIIIAVIIAVIMYVMMSKTTFGYELKACGANRHAAKYAGINDKKNIILSMVIAGGLSGSAAALYWLSGHTEFYWSTYQALPAVGFNGIPVALLAANNPIAVIFSGCFMSILNIAGMQLKTLTAYNEYITDIIIATIVYLSAFSMMIKTIINNVQKKKSEKGGEK
ncbi:MAG: ABC transporter permease [Eubacteriales Family XIII. Incertae Sedis bacterium]|nr:MAG: ABC transporter permease [Clostridiales Family XIII bacterium]